MTKYFSDVADREPFRSTKVGSGAATAPAWRDSLSLQMGV